MRWRWRGEAVGVLSFEFCVLGRLGRWRELVMRILGVDYGTRRTGVALAEMVEGERGMALPFEMFEGLSDLELGGAIGDLCRREGVELIVVGFPLFSDGRPSAQSQITERFILTLGQCTTVPIRRISEHLTSHDSEGKLAGHFTRLQKRQRVDAIAAARILQDYLDENGKGGGTERRSDEATEG